MILQHNQNTSKIICSNFFARMLFLDWYISAASSRLSFYANRPISFSIWKRGFLFSNRVAANSLVKCPVGLSRRIRRIHFSSNKITGYPWVATRSAWGCDLGFLTRQSKWSTDLQQSALTLIELDGWPDRLASITGNVKPYTNLIVPMTIIKLPLSQTNTLFFLKGAWRRWLRVNCDNIAILEAI